MGKKVRTVSEIIGNNLRYARKCNGLTQREVAEKMKMTQQQYSRFENGIFQLNYEQILFLCDLFEISPAELFDIQGKEEE